MVQNVILTLHSVMKKTQQRMTAYSDKTARKHSNPLQSQRLYTIHTHTHIYSEFMYFPESNLSVMYMDNMDMDMYV